MWLTERTIIELEYQHREEMLHARRTIVSRRIDGPSAVLPRDCCRVLARLGHRMMLVGSRMENRYADPQADARPAAATTAAA